MAFSSKKNDVSSMSRKQVKAIVRQNREYLKGIFPDPKQYARAIKALNADKEFRNEYSGGRYL